MLDKPGDIVVGGLKEERFGQGFLLIRNAGVPLEPLRVDDGHVEAGLRAMIEKDGVEHLPPAGGRPNETLLMPKIVLHSGIACLIRRIPSIVSRAEPRYCWSPVAQGKTKGSKMMSSAGLRICEREARRSGGRSRACAGG